MIHICKGENKASIIEVNSETDFVAMNEDFQKIVEKLGKLATNSNDLEDLLSKEISEESILVKDYITEMIASIGENINLRRMEKIENNNGIISSYIHNQVVDNMGKIGVLVSLKSDGEKRKLKDLGKQISMHIAATNPISINVEDIPKEILERERNILEEEARSSGKPEEIIKKMTEGRLNKFYQESVLLEQTFIVDGESKIKDILNTLDKPVVISGFIRMGLGEGIKKKSEDFANEVDSLIS